MAVSPNSFLLFHNLKYELRLTVYGIGWNKTEWNQRVGASVSPTDYHRSLHFATHEQILTLLLVNAKSAPAGFN